MQPRSRMQRAMKMLYMAKLGLQHASSPQSFEWLVGWSGCVSWTRATKVERFAIFCAQFIHSHLSKSVTLPNYCTNMNFSRARNSSFIQNVYCHKARKMLLHPGQGFRTLGCTLAIVTTTTAVLSTAVKMNANSVANALHIPKAYCKE